MSSSRGSEGRAVTSTLLAICWTFVGLRVYVRTRVVKAFGLDDWLLLIALALYTTHSAFGILAMMHGVGQHIVAPKELSYAIFTWWIATMFYVVTTVFVRASIAVFLNKICVKSVHKIIIWVTMSIVIAYSIFYFVITVIQCNPPRYFWDKSSTAKGTCLNPQIMPSATYGHSVVSAVADWVLGLLPLWLIKDLQMNFRTKVSVTIILGLGVIAGIAAMIRIPYVRTISRSDEQFLYTVFDISMWSFAEMSIGIIAASATALRPLFKHFYELSNYGSRTHPSKQSHQRYPPRSTYLRNKSNGTQRDVERDTEMFNMTKAEGRDDSPVMGSASTAVGGFNRSTSQLAGDSRSGSEENLTGAGGAGKDIYVHTVIQVDNDGRRDDGTQRHPQR